jgi:hypothetical protein
MVTMLNAVSRPPQSGAGLPVRAVPRLGRARTLAIVALAVIFVQAVDGQDRTRYRDYQLGNGLSSVAALAKVSPTEAKIVHRRPAIIQELEWRSPYVMSGSAGAVNDPVQRIVFSFYDDQLFKLVIRYDRQRTNGLTDADMIEAISRTYGAALLQPTPKGVSAGASGADLGSPIAQWGEADFSVGLYRSSFASEFLVVVASPRLETLARAATEEAVRLDEREAPQREIDRRQKEAEDSRTSQEKARTANKATFRP